MADTPEEFDPLEEPPLPVPELYDLNRDAATIVNIGDNAPVGREYGGDYRNIVFDFGTGEDLISGFLFLDRELVFPYPNFFEWLIYVSNDPEGRRWELFLEEMM